MRIKLVFLQLSFLFITLISNGQNKTDFLIINDFPGYETIVEHVLKFHYLESHNEDNFYQYRFARKPQGWYVIPEFYSSSGIVKHDAIEIWIRDSGFIIPPSSDSAEISSPDQHAIILSNTNRYNFIVHPFYGYVGWDTDVISFFRKIKSNLLSDHELYGLSRAYINYASNIFWAHSRYADSYLVKSTTAKRSDRRKYMRMSYKAIARLKDLHERNPDYNTLVGLSDVKLTNQIMAQWYELKLFGHDKKASRFIKKTDPNYEDFWAKSSQYILNNLQENAILFTNGDNDTYPHLWNQISQNIRNDVLIINSSLLNDPLYYSLIINGFLHSSKINTGLSKEDLELLGQKYILVVNDSAKSYIPYSNSELNFHQQINSEEKSISLDFGFYSIPFFNTEMESDSLKFLNATRRQISYSQFLLSDLLYYNFDSRPVYFVKSMNPEFQKMFSPTSLLEEGYVIRLSNDAENHPKFFYSYYDPIKVDNLINSSHIRLPDKKYTARMKYFRIIMEMESKMISNDSYSETKEEGLLKYLEKYPPQLTGLSLHYYNLIYTLYQNESQQDLAEMFLKAFIVELENEIRETELIDSDPDDVNHLKYLNYIIRSIVRSGLMPEIPNFYENLSVFEKSINKKLKQMPELKFN